jgi:hypothetical protein
MPAKKPIIDGKKQCSLCKEWKLLADFNKKPSSPSGVSSPCKKCFYEKYTLPNSRKNKAKHNANSRRWYRNNTARSRATSEAWDKAHPTQAKARKRKSIKKWSKNNRDRVNACRRRRKNTPKYKNKNVEYSQKRRARARGLDSTFTSTEWLWLLDICERKCLKCGSTTSNLTQDHIIPVIMNGGYVLENIQPLCSFDNLSKGTVAIDYRTREIRIAVMEKLRNVVTNNHIHV